MRVGLDPRRARELADQLGRSGDRAAQLAVMADRLLRLDRPAYARPLLTAAHWARAEAAGLALRVALIERDSLASPWSLRSAFESIGLLLGGAGRLGRLAPHREITRMAAAAERAARFAPFQVLGLYGDFEVMRDGSPYGGLRGSIDRGVSTAVWGSILAAPVAGPLPAAAAQGVNGYWDTGNFVWDHHDDVGRYLFAEGAGVVPAGADLAEAMSTLSDLSAGLVERAGDIVARHAQTVSLGADQLATLFGSLADEAAEVPDVIPRLEPAAPGAELLMSAAAAAAAGVSSAARSAGDAVDSVAEQFADGARGLADGLDRLAAWAKPW